MTAPDWPSLARRFEAATDDDIYECVRELVGAVGEVRPGFDWRTLVVAASSMPYNMFPDLLLGVVVACVPEDRLWSVGQRLGAAGFVAVVNRDSRSYVGLTPAAALGAAVCRAWESVERGKEVVG